MLDTFEVGNPATQQEIHTKPLTLDSELPNTGPLESVQQTEEKEPLSSSMSYPETSSTTSQAILHPEDTVGLPEKVKRLLDPFVMQEHSEDQRIHEHEQTDSSLTDESSRQNTQTQSPRKSATVMQFSKNLSAEEQSENVTKKGGRVKRFFRKIREGWNSFWRGLRNGLKSDKKRAAEMLRELEKQEETERYKAA